MPDLINILKLERCPHCGVAAPNLPQEYEKKTSSFSGNNLRFWKVYECNNCGGLILASSFEKKGRINEIFPNQKIIDESIPNKAKEYLKQASDSLHAPAGAVVLSASAVDSMLKQKGYKVGSLYDRINKAVKENIITDDMAKWAHDIRLDANDQRHADESAPLPNQKDTERCLEFAFALAEFLYVLPSRVKRGLEEAKKKE